MIGATHHSDSSTTSRRQVLRGVPYGVYERLASDPRNAHVRLTYHDGTLEIMSPEYLHEIPTERIGTLVRVLAHELNIAYAATGSLTFRKKGPGELKGVGKEPDRSFYFRHAPKIEGKERIDLDAGDPPPDLWIEVDNRASSLGKLPLYARLEVPEVWRYRPRKRQLAFFQLTGEGGYAPIERSACLPMLTPAPVLEGLALRDGVLDHVWETRLREWIRATFGQTG